MGVGRSLTREDERTPNEANGVMAGVRTSPYPAPLFFSCFNVNHPIATLKNNTEK
jgi:hypothetical protein